MFFSVKSVISTSQHGYGYVSGRSTVTNLIEFTTYILNSLEDGVQIDAIYTEFSKAFDKVNHRLLLHKLSTIGFGVSFLKWIASNLTNRKQYVKASGHKSRVISVKSGVPQGDFLFFL
jgi:Reverse transcriptase (RNA-dependent DNA polymerase)